LARFFFSFAPAHGRSARQPKDMPFAVFYFSVSAGSISSIVDPNPSLSQGLGLGVLFGLAQTSRMLGYDAFMESMFFSISIFLCFPQTTQKHWSTISRKPLSFCSLPHHILFSSWFPPGPTWVPIFSTIWAACSTWPPNSPGKTTFSSWVRKFPAPRSPLLPSDLVCSHHAIFILFFLEALFWKTPKFLKNEAWALRRSPWSSTSALLDLSAVL